MKRKLFVYVSILLGAFLIYNIIWYFGTYRIYASCENGFQEISDSGIRIFVDEEEYQYSVNKPTYLCWDGNLALSEKNIDHALIIWYGVFGIHKEAGVILTSENKETFQIELSNKHTPLDSRNQEIVSKNSETIEKLYNKANQRWKLELE